METHFTLFKVGLKYSETVVMRVTGCPNGCARPYMAELGLVGDGPNSYQVREDVCFDIYDASDHLYWQFNACIQRHSFG